MVEIIDSFACEPSAAVTTQIVSTYVFRENDIIEGDDDDAIEISNANLPRRLFLEMNGLTMAITVRVEFFRCSVRRQYGRAQALVCEFSCHACTYM